MYNIDFFFLIQEKFKREFQQRFFFKRRKWRSSTAESVDTDKTLIAGRPSLRSTTTTIDWRTNQSTPRSYSYFRDTNGHYYSSSSRSFKKSQRDRNKDMYVMQSSRGGAVVHCTSESEFDELCL